jgi:predicted TIM-barrel fold metal-dependent hydrolase
LPALSGRLDLIGLERWVPNPEGITPTEMREHLARLFVDTAATMPTALGPALAMTGLEHIVYGSDCGVPCSTDATMDANLLALRERAGLSPDQVQFIGRNALSLFPKAAARMQK